MELNEVDAFIIPLERIVLCFYFLNVMIFMFNNYIYAIHFLIFDGLKILCNISD